MTNGARLSAQAGLSLVEMMIATGVMAGVLIALGSSMSTYSVVTTARHHESQAVEQARAILDAASSEIMQTTTQLNHDVLSGISVPLASEEEGTTVHPLYNFPLVGVGTLHDGFERDGFEYWHPKSPDRMYWIYATYESFDTIEFRSVRVGASDGGVADFMSTDGELSTPWSRSRKIFRLDDRVIMRVQRDLNDPNDFDDVVLGTNVSDLEFHVDDEGNIIMYVETLSGEEPENGESSSEGAIHQEQRMITPINDL